MYVQRKNFNLLDVPSANKKKAEAKKILSSIMEVSSLEALNNLYQDKEVPKDHILNQPTSTQTVPSRELKFTSLSAAGDDEAQIKKAYDDTLVLGVADKRNNKPYKVIFTELPNENEVATEMTEATEVLEDEVLVPMEFAPEEVQKDSKNEEETESDEEKIKEHDEEEATESDEEKIKEHDEEGGEDEVGEGEYDPLEELPPLDLSADMMDAINKASQGMMPNIMINPTINVMSDKPLGSITPMHKGDRIQKIEDDLDGLSLVGFSNPFAERFLK